ncbi:hypothetical protein BJY00DRAFT_247227 [Aspergillus carlsbadensis]|nr:hypothetical protein BJY00DRAFT_247227 [Aspergillus carlsbadensis]
MQWDGLPGNAEKQWDRLPFRVEKFACYRLRLVDYTLDKNSSLCPLDKGRHTSLAKVGLGNLGKFPQEILGMILGKLDIQSLTKFRRVNRRAMQAVDSIRAYQQIVMRFSTALRAILSIGTGATYSCQDLYNELQFANCRHCGRFGGFLYLLTCRRVCIVCVRYFPLYTPILSTDVTEVTGGWELDPHDLATLPTMRTVPGYYTEDKIHVQQKLIMYDEAAVFDRATARYGWKAVMDRARDRKRDTARRDDRSESPSSLNLENRGLRCFMALIRAPVFKGSALDWGVYCSQCRKGYTGGDFLDFFERGEAFRMFGPKEFEDHIGQHIQDTEGAL